MKRRRAIFGSIVVAMVVLLVGLGVYFVQRQEGGDNPLARPDSERSSAIMVDRLNARDASHVLAEGPTKQIQLNRERNAGQFFPAPGCRYTLVDVANRGKQSLDRYPDAEDYAVNFSNGIYRVDVSLREECSTGDNHEKAIAVMYLVDMSDWAPGWIVDS